MTTVAVTVVCAVTVLAAPGTAFASAGAGPSPSATRAVSGAAASAPAGAAANPAARPAPPASPASPASPAPGKDLEAVREKLDALYRAASVATDEYNAAEEKTREQSAEIVELAKKIVEGQEKLDRLKDRAGAAARAQYRTGGLPDEAKLVLSEDPEDFLDGSGRVIQGQRATKGLLGEMARTQEDLRAYAADASAQWRELERNRKAKATAQRKIEQRIAAAKKLESELEKEEKERLARLERLAQEKAQAAWLGSGALKDLGASATGQGRKAVEYATAQIGKPYVWGAEGPDAYDCSGLTSRAWASAGQPIPRTSQEQWKRLRHVGVGDLRPGDLIIYFADASHVGMYVGGGTIVHAPRPGRSVTLAGAGTMPILGVVRPDAHDTTGTPDTGSAPASPTARTR